MTIDSMEEPSVPIPLRSRDLSNLSSLSSLSKSDSNASAGAQSFRSHASIPVIGAHPYGTLRVHQVSDSPRAGRSQESRLSREILMKPLPDEPPPLEGDDLSWLEPTANSTGNETSGAGTSTGTGDLDVVLILDLPPNFTIGYDAVSFKARNFQGVRDVPPGPHFFWASETESSSVRSGFWIVASSPSSSSSGRGQDGRIHVVQWDRFNEVLGPPASQTEARIQRENAATLYPQLAPYQHRASIPNLRAASLRQGPGQGGDPGPGGSSTRRSPGPEPDLAKSADLWPRLAGFVTPAVLDRVVGRSDGAWAVHTSDRVRGAHVIPAEAELERRLLPSAVAAGAELRFAFSQSAKTFDLESTGAARTRQAVDATSHVASILEDPARGLTEDDLVGELQLAFVTGMHLGNEACIQQWWHVVLRVVFRAYALAASRPRLARELVRAVAAQLAHDDRHLDGSVLDHGGGRAGDELRLALIVYKRRLNELLLGLNGRATAEQASVGRAFSELETWVWRFGWDIRSDYYLRSGKAMLEDGEEVDLEMDELEDEDERGEYAAVVVDLDEHGRQRDLVSWS